MELKNKLNSKVLTGMFYYRENLENVYAALCEKGYTIEDINLVMLEETCKKYFLNGVTETEIKINL